MKHSIAVSSLITLMFVIIMGVGMISSLYAEGPNNLFEYEPSILDARGEALGHSSLLTSDGANNVFNNPVMIALQKQKSIVINCRSIDGENKYKELNRTYKTEYKFYPVMNGLAFSMPIQDKGNQDFRYGVGLGYRLYYDYGLKYHLEEEYSPNSEEKISGGFKVITFSMASWYRKVGMGLSVNVGPKSKTTYRTEYSEDDREVYTATVNNRGRFVVLSFMYQPRENLSLALRHRLPFKFEVTSYYGMSSKNFPAETVVAAAYSPIEFIRCYGELNTRNIGDYFTYYGDSDVKPNDGYGAHIGVEIGDKVLLRVGAYTQSSKYADEEINNQGSTVDKKNTNMEQGITTGLGYRGYKNLTLDVAYSYSTLEYSKMYNEKYECNRSKIFCTVGVNFN